MADSDRANEEEPQITQYEWCVEKILSHTTPRDACILALVNKVFRAASASNLVWDKMLPARNSEIVEQADGDSLQFASKKELYFQLCKSVSLNSGNQRYWIDRPTGAECYMLSARALSIVWGNDQRYWEWISTGGSWFQDVAHLKTVCWFEIKGRFERILQMGTYTASFRIQMDHLASGWNNAPINFSVSSSAGNHEESVQYFDHFSVGNRMPRLSESSPNSTVSQNDWVEYDAGEVRVEDGHSVDLHVSMAETKIGWWKNGLSIDGLIIRPSHVVRRLAMTSTMVKPPLIYHDSYSEFRHRHGHLHFG